MASPVPPAMLSNIDEVVQSSVPYVLSAAAIGALAALLLGGFQYLMAGSDKEAASRARAIITFGLIGMLVAGLSWSFLNLTAIFLGVTPEDVLNFTICLPTGC